MIAPSEHIDSVWHDNNQSGGTHVTSEVTSDIQLAKPVRKLATSTKFEVGKLIFLMVYSSFQWN